MPKGADSNSLFFKNDIILSMETNELVGYPQWSPQEKQTADKTNDFTTNSKRQHLANH